MSKSLVGSLPIYAQHLAELTGVQVIISNNGSAYTNGKQVCVPFAEDDLPLSFGYVAHECSHVRNTDMRCFAEAAATPFRKSVLNILEDIRIEKLSIEQYPGTEGDLFHLVKTVLGSQLSPEDAAKKQPLAIVHDTLLLAGRWMALGQDLEQPARVMLDAQEQLLGSALSAEIMQMACTVTRCNSTREVLQLADAIIAKLPSEQEEPQGGGNQSSPNQEQQQQDSQEAGSDGEGQQKDEEAGAQAGGEDDQSEQQGDGAGGEGSGDEDDSAQDGQAAGAQGDEQGGEGDEQGSDADSEPKNSAGNQPGNQQEQQSEQGAGSDTADTPAQDAAQGGQGAGSNPPSPQARGLREQAENATEKDLEGLISEVGDKAAEILSKNAQRMSRSVVKPLPLAGRALARSDMASQRRIRLGTEQSSGLRQTLMGLLQAQVDCRVALRRHGRRVDAGRLAMLPAGETRIFRNKTRVERHSAAIQILLDKSGSMSKDIDEAEAAVYAVLKALENIPMVTTGAMSFPNSDALGYTCCALIKSPKERLADAVSKGGFGAFADGGTPLAEAIWPAATEVLRAKGERKVLFVITDGQPDYAVKSKEMVARCEASGIDVIGLGFGGATESVLSGIFSKYKVVGTVGNLKRELYIAVRESLQG